MCKNNHTTGCTPKVWHPGRADLDQKSAQTWCDLHPLGCISEREEADWNNNQSCTPNHWTLWPMENIELYSTFILVATWLLIPKPKLMLRSIPMPRSQPMSSYPLYSSLVFHLSQAPISITTKVPCPATISTDPPFLAEALLITRRLCIVSIEFILIF